MLPAQLSADEHDIAVAFIAEREGFRSRPYHDTAGYATVGYGERLSDVPGADLSQFASQTEAEARDWLSNRVRATLVNIDHLVTVDMDDYQAAALASFTYNLGVSSLADSKLLLLINGDSPAGVVIGEWVTWDKEHRGGRLVRSRGLSNRRALEAVLFSTMYYRDEVHLEAQ